MTPRENRPWTAIPAARSSAPVLRVKLALLLSVALLAMVCGPVALLITATRHTPAPVALGSTNSEVTAAAQLVAQDYLAGRPTEVPVAGGTAQVPSHVSSNFSISSLGVAKGAFHYVGLAFAGYVTKYDDLTQYQIDSFLVETTSGIFTLTVPMIVSADGPVLGALPSLAATSLPTSNALDPLNYSTDTGFVEGNNAYPADASYIASAVTAWASAFASDNQSGLQSVAKYATPPVYPALGGFRAVSSTIESEVATTTGLYVRVAVVLKQGSFTTLSEYDLLLANANTASPSVVSWGAAGAAPLTTF